MTREISVGLVIFTCILGLFIGACAKKQVAVSGQEGVPAGEIGKTQKDQPSVDRPKKDRDLTLRDLEAEREGKVPLTMEEKGFEDEMIFFEYDSYALTPKAMSVLEKKASWLKKNPHIKIRIEGHCDERGTNEYNLALGDRRANAAKSYLISLGVSPDRISTISYGEELPLDPRHSEEAWAKNRRAEFKIIK